jgi:P27 family predicted phage terminase small subunit
VPARKPAKLLLLNGRDNGKDSAGRPVSQSPNFVRSAPEPPAWLDREAAEEWERVVPGLERLDLVKAEDRAALVVYCQTWSRFVTAMALYRKEGLVLTNPDSGRAHKHPAVTIAETAARQLLTFANEFGLTAAAERRIATASGGGGADDESNNPFAWRPA